MSLTSPDTFQAFALAAVIVQDTDFVRVEQQWKTFKRTHFGFSSYRIHEPDIRRQGKAFRNPAKRATILPAMAATIAALPFTAIVVTVHRLDYAAMFGAGPVDASLPAHPYMMALDFMAERVALALEMQYGGARSKVVCESREKKEDATLQYEFARLHLDGTSYVSAAFFRQAFNPGITFYSKQENVAGLELADLLARPVAEKVLNPASTPPRWPEFRQKLCQQKETKNSILGLKIMPWAAKYVDIWKS